MSNYHNTPAVSNSFLTSFEKEWRNISNYLKKEGIDIVITNEPKNNKTTVDIFLDYGNNKDALRNGADGNTNGNKENYKKCSKYLKSKNELYIKYYKDEDTGFSIVSLIKNFLNI